MARSRLCPRKESMDASKVRNEEDFAEEVGVSGPWSGARSSRIFADVADAQVNMEWTEG
jgi:hypothetical protein